MIGENRVFVWLYRVYGSLEGETRSRAKIYLRWPVVGIYNIYNEKNDNSLHPTRGRDGSSV